MQHHHQTLSFQKSLIPSRKAEQEREEVVQVESALFCWQARQSSWMTNEVAVAVAVLKVQSLKEEEAVGEEH